MSKRLIKPWHRRRFVRTDADVLGPESTITAKVVVDRETLWENDEPTKEKRPCIDSTLTIRDCNNSITLTFWATGKRKNAERQLAVIQRLVEDLEVLALRYELAIEAIDAAGEWK